MENIRDCDERKYNETFLELVLQMRAAAICDRRINVRDDYLPVKEPAGNELYKHNS